MNLWHILQSLFFSLLFCFDCGHVVGLLHQNHWNCFYTACFTTTLLSLFSQVGELRIIALGEGNLSHNLLVSLSKCFVLWQMTSSGGWSSFEDQVLLCLIEIIYLFLTMICGDDLNILIISGACCPCP